MRFTCGLQPITVSKTDLDALDSACAALERLCRVLDVERIDLEVLYGGLVSLRLKGRQGETMRTDDGAPLVVHADTHKRAREAPSIELSQFLASAAMVHLATIFPPKKRAKKT